MSAAAARRGNRYLQVRLPDEMHEKLKEAVGEGDGGKAGGVSLFVRRLIHRELGEPLPPQWGKEQGSLNDMIAALAEIDSEPDTEKAVSLYRDLLATADEEEDLVTRNLAFTMIGRLTPLLMSAGVLELWSSSWADGTNLETAGGADELRP